MGEEDILDSSTRGDLDDYDVDLEDIFGDGQTHLPSASGRVLDSREILGLEDAISVARIARVPRVRLDEQRYFLMCLAAFPSLRNHF